MTRKEVVDAVIESLRRFIGDEDREISEHTRPIRDLDLESQDGIAWVLDLEDLGFRIPPDLNPLVDDERHRARSVREIVELAMKYAD